jgi:transcriptional/translational regulatory protein YebC/TACO1
MVLLEYQGGSDDPVANRMLADVIKAAKMNNVPIDVSV